MLRFSECHGPMGLQFLPSWEVFGHYHLTFSTPCKASLERLPTIYSYSVHLDFFFIFELCLKVQYSFPLQRLSEHILLSDSAVLSLDILLGDQHTCSTPGNGFSSVSC